MTLVRSPVTFVGEVVRSARECVQRRDMGPHPSREEYRRHRKVLVMRATIANARGVGGIEIYHTASPAPIGRFAASAVCRLTIPSRRHLRDGSPPAPSRTADRL